MGCAASDTRIRTPLYLCRCDTVMLLKQGTKVAGIGYSNFGGNLTYGKVTDF